MVMLKIRVYIFLEPLQAIIIMHKFEEASNQAIEGYTYQIIEQTIILFKLTAIKFSIKQWLIFL